jgi:hypothetical protein
MAIGAANTLSDWYPLRPARGVPPSIVARNEKASVDELCYGWVRLGASGGAIEAVRAAMRARFGEHPSRLPNYQPPWKLARENALRQQALTNNQPQPPKG